MTQTARTGAPVITKVHRQLGRLDHMLGRLERQVAEWRDLPDDHPNKERLRASHQFNEENIPAIKAAVAALSYYAREVEGEAHASLLLSQLVEAVRATQAAKTPETKMEAAGLLEEAMSHAGPWVDDWSDE